ncbi:protein of unknown function [Desulfonispora thiosulfatigenes DSM 11270]|uniref:DUF3298 domain-containing protein n=1 Tax=Desulfonispora thiosulfatigenes DSM 11270 TaxID=656914 RepID=A0A1W1UQJ3_DESTI|nr:DUF3298 and DUF4163 domain-containing protein [Desulfonispora thiosulfatigenes]SMB83326.1 protein of unknown function [Desulfonispora thiosulfatigenes DSM 11270]
MDKSRFPVNTTTMRLVRPRMDIYYPVVHDYNINPYVAQRVNTTIANKVHEMNVKQGFYENPQTEVSGFYEIKNNQRSILSISLGNYAYSGGAHGLTLMDSLTFNMQTGQKYELKDLFKKGSNYVQVLSDIIKKQIEQRDISLFEEFTGIKRNQEFYIADKSLVIYFQLYELTAYAYGIPYFPISIYEIEDIIDEEGPLGMMFGSF